MRRNLFFLRIQPKRASRGATKKTSACLCVKAPRQDIFSFSSSLLLAFLREKKKETDEMILSTTRKKVKRLLSLYTEVQKDTTNGRTIFGWLECDRYCYSRDDHRDHRCFASVKARKTLFAPAEVNAARVLNFFFFFFCKVVERPPQHPKNRQQRERERGKKHAKSLPKPSSSLFACALKNSRLHVRPRQIKKKHERNAKKTTTTTTTTTPKKTKRCSSVVESRQKQRRQ